MEPAPSAPTDRRAQLLFWTLAVVVLALLGWRTSGRSNEGDLRVYYETVARISQGHDLYHQRETATPDEPTGYIYPPLFAAVFLPLTKLPFPFLRGLWFFLMGLLALRSYRVAFTLVERAIPPPEGRARWLALVLGALISVRFAWSDLGHGQVNLLVMWLTVEGIGQAERGRDRAGGALLALAVLIKLTPGIVIAGYLLRGRWQLVGASVAAGLVGLLLPALLFGLGTNLDYLLRFVTSVTAWNAEYHTYVGNNAALTSWVKRMLVGQAENAGMTPRPLLLGLNPAAVGGVCVLISLSVLGGALFLARRAGDSLRGTALLLAAIPLVSPVAWKPHLVCLILPGLLAGRLLLEPGRHRGPLVGALVLVGLSGRMLLGRDLANGVLLWGGVSCGLVLLAAGLALESAHERASD